MSAVETGAIVFAVLAVPWVLLCFHSPSAFGLSREEQLTRAGIAITFMLASLVMLGDALFG